jgi:hypothetical protein
LIGRRGTVDCPPQSCDQTPCWFFGVGHNEE